MSRQREAHAALATVQARSARRFVLLMIVLTFAVSAPLLTLHTAFGDDWAWVWIHHWQGAAGIQEKMWEVAHPGYGPVLNLFFWLGGDSAASVARAAAVLLHLANGWLLWRIFADARGRWSLAATISALYLTAPFLGNLRPTLSHAPYDVFIFFYLVSIRLSARPGLLVTVAALCCQIVGLSIETLAALEGIRWWLFYTNGERRRGLIKRAAPFVIVILALLVSRVTWLVPYGVYASHNALKPFDAVVYWHHALAELHFFVVALEPTHFVVQLVRYDSPFIPAALALVAVACAIARHRADDGTDAASILPLSVAGAIVLGLGILPYVAVERDPTWTGFYARFAVASQFGVFILAAAAIELLRGALLRASVVGAAVFVLSATQLQISKWALYDQAVFDDFEHQLAAEFSHHDNELLFVHFAPPSDHFFYIDRCLANYDINVPLDIANKRGNDFAYDADCGAALYTSEGKCGVTGFEQQPCPPKWDARFALEPGSTDFRRFQIGEFIRANLGGPPQHFGSLTVDRSSGPVRVGPSP